MKRIHIHLSSFGKWTLSGVIIFVSLMVTCERFEPERHIILTTDTVLDVNYYSCLVKGYIFDESDEGISQLGLCWSTSKNPTISDDTSQIGKNVSTGSFQGSVTGLQAGTEYYTRAYALNSKKTSYGNELRFETKSYTLPVVVTGSVTNISHESAIVSGEVSDEGGTAISVRGVCWSTSQSPTITENVLNSDQGSGNFSVTLSNLDCSTTYYLRAYATNTVGTAYGDQVSFTTSDCPKDCPTVTTGSIDSITENSAKCEGNVIDDGGALVTERGVCWSTSQNPTLDDYYSTNGDSVGSFTCTISGLSCKTTYYVRAYATNSVCTSFGSQVSFTTSNCPEYVPTVITNDISEITFNSAIGGGEVIDDGGSPVTARGVCWSTSSTPTLDDLFTTDGTGSGSYTSILTSLSANTTYNVRAYATNSNGTGYGQNKSFTTSQSMSIPTVTTSTASSIDKTSATVGGNVTDDGGATVTERGVYYGTTSNPQNTGTKVAIGSGTGSFSTTLSGLTCETTYYITAYAMNSAGTSYGPVKSFSTSQCSVLAPSVITSEVTSISGSSAVVGGNVIDDGGATVTERGVFYGTSSNPQTTGEKVAIGSGTGTFITTITGLSGGTMYYVQAYATNSSGTAYGNQVSFTTPDLPTLSTLEITDITDQSAKGGGEVISDGGSEVTARGVCWNVFPNPNLTVFNNEGFTTDGTGEGNFTSSLFSLTTNTTYYVRSYATNSAGTAYGPEVTFTTWSGTVVDYDGNVYNTIKIGDQMWMAENLKVTRFNNGYDLYYAKLEDASLELPSRYYCYYNWDPSSYSEEYGALYSRSTANIIDLNICPAGWHVPGDHDWIILENYLGGSSIAGGKMKETGTAHWDDPNSGATNESRFTALPGGYLIGDDAPGGGVNRSFIKMGSTGYWLSSRVQDVRKIKHDQTSLDMLEPLTDDDYMNAGSIRCVKDSP